MKTEHHPATYGLLFFFPFSLITFSLICHLTKSPFAIVANYLFCKAKCNFFVWVDLPPCDCGRDELLQNIDQLERELEKSKAEERRQRGMFVATWVAIFCFMVLYLTK
ncbi:hypothetical protein RHMOL_Rhmol11G0272900 [Rhododendron molle]|uniref:Uncharacterized protein n=1 Tax=Rhododendron molle TaxID=49168 RepID=A0ACC0LX37_RHOML|nr:hypothetical protein RHMOL_Rhmol11G0272900 [Rhododendron molle]